MENLIDLFYDEAYEMLEGMEQVLLSLEERGHDPETVNALFRYAHSFKGNSAAMGFTQLSRFTHGLESAMESLRREGRPLTPELATLLLQAVDLIRVLLERARTEGDVGDPACDLLLSQIQTVLAGSPTPCDPSAPPQSLIPAETPTERAARRYRVVYQPAPTLSSEHDPLALLRELEEYAQVIHCRFHHQ
ncbi:MAG: Hpt domain-containing protein, partial [Fimbriimonadales bacterium]